MKRAMILVAAVTMFWFISGNTIGGVTPEKSMRFLKGDELRAFFSDVTMKGKHFKKGKATAYWSTDGTYYCKFKGGQIEKGSWSVKGNSYKRCVKTSSGKKWCNRVGVNSDGTYGIYKPNGKKKVCAVTSVKKGNHM